MMKRCQECQTYGDEENALIEIAVDDGEGIYQCESCIASEEEMYAPAEDAALAGQGEG
jgi:hypothetical protein